MREGFVIFLAGAGRAWSAKGQSGDGALFFVRLAGKKKIRVLSLLLSPSFHPIQKTGKMNVAMR